MEPFSHNLYTHEENDPINFDDPSGHGIISGLKNLAKKATSAASKAVQAVKRVVVLKVTTKAKTSVASAIVKSTVSAAAKAAVKVVAKKKLPKIKEINYPPGTAPPFN